MNARSKHSISLPDNTTEITRPGYQPQLGGWIFFEDGQTKFTTDTRDIPRDQWMLLESLGLCCAGEEFRILKPCVGFNVAAIRECWAA